MRLRAETVKAGISPVRYYEAQGLDFKRQPNAAGWALTICPFHEDKTPSLSVNLSHGGFCCFACGVKGDLIRFHCMKTGLPFNAALQDLARRFL